MINRSLTVLLLMILAVPGLRADDAAKTSEVRLKDLVLQLPNTWKTAPSAGNMRLATYTTPVADGDSEPGEFTVFSFAGGGGGVADNLSRWVGQFSSDGRTSKITKGMAGETEYYVADISGTFNKPVGPPILRKTEAAPGFRMLAAIVVLEGKGVYYLKLSGPDATIKAQAEAFRASFGGDSKTETDFEI
ncbi:MAG: hypothetical protein KDA89_01515 [Planctomycetaceae bacterium]|nr:hypothetical protein [Planctomycetaceae bacterium]